MGEQVPQPQPLYRKRRNQEAIDRALLIADRDAQEVEALRPRPDQGSRLIGPHGLDQSRRLFIAGPRRRFLPAGQPRALPVHKGHVARSGQEVALGLAITVDKSLLPGQGLQGRGLFLQPVAHPACADLGQRPVPLLDQRPHRPFVAVDAGKGHADEHQRQGQDGPEHNLGF